MRQRFYLLLAAVALFTCFNLDAQTNDFGTWIEIEVEKRINNKLRLEFEEEIRIFQNFSEIDRLATSLGASWTFNRNFRVGGGYAWLYKHRINRDLWEHRHRFHFYARGRIRVDRFTITLRERVQSTYRDESIEGFRYNPRLYLRSRLQASYNIRGSKITPYSSAEMYYQLNNPAGNQIDKMRYTAGVSWPLSKTLEMSNFLRLDQDVNAKNPVSLYILGISLNVEL